MPWVRPARIPAPSRSLLYFSALSKNLVALHTSSGRTPLLQIRRVLRCMGALILFLLEGSCFMIEIDFSTYEGLVAQLHQSRLV